MVVVITAVVIVGLWVMRSGQTRPGGRDFDCTAPPDAPRNLAYTKNGDDVQGTWEAAAAGERPTSYIIEVGSRPGFNDLGTFVVPATQTNFGGKTPPNTYFGRVFARNACGTSPASNEINYTVP